MSRSFAASPVSGAPPSRSRGWLRGFGTIVAVSAALVRVAAGPSGHEDEELSGGGTTAYDHSRNAFSLSARNLTDEHRAPFFVGHSFFNENWLAATASVSSRDGLGPLFVARSCSACHAKDGRGAPPEAGLALETMVIRISIPGTGEHGGSRPDPIYGSQLQTHSLPEVKPEGEVLVNYGEIGGQYDDGEQYYLRQPVYFFLNPGYGALATNATLSALVSPAMIGLGLLESVPAETLRQLEKRRQPDKISGRLNIVWDAAAQRMAPGRFGWKAEQPTVRQQCAVAFNGDMGLTTKLFPRENYTEAEGICSNLPSGGVPEVSDDIFESVVLYARLLAVPARRDLTNTVVRRGQELFHKLNCSACHVPRLETGDVPGYPELSRQAIRPYTDLLLHDLGPGLADHRHAFEAGARDWRTAPLWGIGLVATVNGHQFFLHDGRARGLAEAILWHGGEAEPARERFRRLEKSDREALLRFLESL